MVSAGCAGLFAIMVKTLSGFEVYGVAEITNKPDLGKTFVDGYTRYNKEQEAVCVLEHDALQDSPVASRKNLLDS
jgi:hypothetical protein